MGISLRLMESKSAIIRRLYQEGKSISAIAKELGLTYQRVYNTLRRAKLLPAKGGEEPSKEAYAEFIAGLEILGVELLEVHGKLERSPQGQKRFGPAPDGVSVFGPIRTEEGFQAGLTLKLEFQDEGGPFGFLHLFVAARYRSPVFPDEALFKLFQERNLPLNLWPYLRVYVDFLTTQMGLPRLVLPALKL